MTVPFGGYQEYATASRTPADREVMQMYAELATADFEDVLRERQEWTRRLVRLIGEGEVAYVAEWLQIGELLAHVNDFLESMDGPGRYPGQTDVSQTDSAFELFRSREWPVRNLESSTLWTVGTPRLLFGDDPANWWALFRAWRGQRWQELSPELRPRWTADREQSLLLFLLDGLRQQSKLILRLLNGDRFIVPADLSAPRIAWLRERAVRSDSNPALLEPSIHTLLMERPFPFSQCPVCKRVFVREGRGRPRLYCSDRCKTKGVPSAPRRSEYVRNSRKKKREREIKRVRELIEGVPRSDRYKHLETNLPGKPRPALLYLLRQADRLPGSS